MKDLNETDVIETSTETATFTAVVDGVEEIIKKSQSTSETEKGTDVEDTVEAPVEDSETEVEEVADETTEAPETSVEDVTEDATDATTTTTTEDATSTSEPEKGTDVEDTVEAPVEDSETEVEEVADETTEAPETSVEDVTEERVEKSLGGFTEGTAILHSAPGMTEDFQKGFLKAFEYLTKSMTSQREEATDASEKVLSRLEKLEATINSFLSTETVAKSMTASEDLEGKATTIAQKPETVMKSMGATESEDTAATDVAIDEGTVEAESQFNYGEFANSATDYFLKHQSQLPLDDANTLRSFVVANASGAVDTNEETISRISNIMKLV